MRAEPKALVIGQMARYLFFVLAVASFVAFLAPAAEAQTFAPIGPLFFTKPLHGFEALPQTLTIVSTGATFNFTATAVTTTTDPLTGLPWLFIGSNSSD